MSEHTSDNRPFALENAKNELQQQITTLVNTHLQQTQKPLVLDVSIGEGGPEVGPLSDAQDGLVDRVRDLVAHFHAQDIVRASSVRVGHVTAIDSNGDGQAAVNVRFVYTSPQGDESVRV